MVDLEKPMKARKAGKKRKVESREASSQVAPVPVKLFKEGTGILKSFNTEHR